MNTTSTDNALMFLAGGGELGKLTREKDWSKTTLGAAERWPQSLRTALSIILNSKFPMFLFWGKDLVCFYNDAYRPSLGKDGKHPSILGMKGEEGWPEIWVYIKPLIDQVLAGGEATWSEDQLLPIYRNGQLEDVYWTFSYSPVNDESGKPAGVFVTCSETTEKVRVLQALGESRDQLEFAIQSADLGTWDYNPITNKFSSNERLKDWFGFPKTNELELTDAVNAMIESDRSRANAAIQRAMEISSGGKYDIQYTIVNRITKTQRIVRAKGRAWFNEQGIAYRFNGTLQDVTEQAIAHQKIEGSELRFRTLATQFAENIKLAPVAMCILKGPAHVVEIANEMMLEIWGKTASEMVNKPIFQGLPEAKGQGLEPILDAVFAKGERYEAFERPVKLPRQGKLAVTFINFVYEPFKEHDGTVSGIIVVASEVTTQVTARAKVEESEARFRSLITQLPMATVFLKGPEHVIEIANSAMVKRWKKTTDELTNKRFADVFPEVNEQKFGALLDHVYKTGETHRELETRSFLRDGDGKREFYIDFEYSPLLEADGTVAGIIATVNDVTDKVMARKQIEESEQRYHDLIYSSPSAIGILYGEELRITIANDAIIEIWGKGRDIIGKPYFDALPEFAEQGYGEIFGEVFKTGIPFNALETPLNIVQHGKMQLKYYNFLLFAQRSLTGDIDGIGIIATEVTSKAILNMQVQESEIRFRMLADSMPQHIWTSDAQGNLNYFNQSVFDFSGLSLAQINTGGWLQIVHPDDREGNIREWTNAITSGTDFLFEHRFRRHDGEYRWQLSRATPQRDASGKIQIWVGTSTDIQDQKTFTTKLEEEVMNRTRELAANNIELSKMNKELQSFAYISSHDLQEPLRKIQTFASRINEKEIDNLSERGKDYFSRIQAAAFRMQRLIQDLLAYSRTDTSEGKTERTDLNKIVQEVTDDLKEELLQNNARVEASDLCDIDIIPFQFRQLLQNLISNSLKFANRERSPVISITSHIDIASEFKEVNLVPGKRYCQISIADNGVGFDPKYNEKIFGLFQRLHGKSEYDGTGIGLAIVKKIVENHRGVIVAHGEPGRGATFDIYFPVV